MTGWWTARTTSREVLWSYSVRPDLWGPGLVVEYTSDNLAMLAEWHWPDQVGQVTGWCAEAEALGLGAPGVAESLTLANKLDLESPDPGITWTPGPKPAPGRPTW